MIMDLFNFKYCMIVYYITHPSCRRELYKYFILNIIRHTSIEYNSVQMFKMVLD